MDLDRFRDQINGICAEFDVARLAVFGSVARGTDEADSDVDLLVRFKRPVGLVDLLRLESRFERTFGRKVDLGTESSLHPLIEKNVRHDLRVIYEAYERRSLHLRHS